MHIDNSINAFLVISFLLNICIQKHSVQDLVEGSEQKLELYTRTVQGPKIIKYRGTHLDEHGLTATVLTRIWNSDWRHLQRRLR
jgi:hypothetical protein